MTRQITIKLNEKRFKPLLDKLSHNGLGSVKSYSELVGKIILFDYLMWSEKCKKLTNKTKMQFIIEKIKTRKNKMHEEFLKVYKNFVKKGKLPKNCTDFC